ncbi:MAG: DNA-binding protein HU [Gammaproteobacteria bacterium GWE2_37_16]|nr:MAG: DNA-binding protein HU [Gammaproteobacteria bacterium GWE2_37_16]
MTKVELIKEIATKCNVSKSVAEQMLSTTLGSITKSLSKGNKVAFIGFGTFSVKKRKARTGRNPQTGKPLKIAAKKVPHFSAGKKLKEAVAK